MTSVRMEDIHPYSKLSRQHQRLSLNSYFLAFFLWTVFFIKNRDCFVPKESFIICTPVMYFTIKVVYVCLYVTGSRGTRQSPPKRLLILREQKT